MKTDTTIGNSGVPGKIDRIGFKLFVRFICRSRFSDMKESINYQSSHECPGVEIVGEMSKRKQRDLMEKERMELTDMGDLMFQRKRYLKALKYYNDVISLDPGYKTGHLKKGDALKELKRLREALFSYNKAIEIDPDFALAIENKGLVLMMMRKYENAMDCFIKSLKSNPHNKETWYLNGLAHLRTGSLDEAIDSFEHSLHLDPRYKSAWKSKGDALMERGDLKEALIAMKKAMEIDPKYEKCKESLKILKERILALKEGREDKIEDITDYEEYDLEEDNGEIEELQEL